MIEIFIKDGEFDKLKGSVKDTKEVFCNECKYQKSCIESKNIDLVKYPNGNMGYAKIKFTHYFSNSCMFKIDEY